MLCLKTSRYSAVSSTTAFRVGYAALTDAIERVLAAGEYIATDVTVHSEQADKIF